MDGFRARLTAQQKSKQSLLCVGLDPLLEEMPKDLRGVHTSDWSATLTWMGDIVRETAPFACAVKAQRAHWEAIPGGEGALRKLMQHIKSSHPDLLRLVDCKRGDIARTQKQYREAHFTLDLADGINFNGYMGRGTLESLIDREHPERALIGLARTSNPDAWEVQDEKLASGLRVWERSLQRIVSWSSELGVLDNAGAVMGAAHPDPLDKDRIYDRHLTSAREMVGRSLWFLIPGIGSQGGLVKETVRASFVGAGSIMINDSSSIDFASKESDYAEAAGGKAEERRDEIRRESGNI